MRVQTKPLDFALLKRINHNANRVILHVDANCFYASCECLYNPDIRDKPVAVCGDPEMRHGIILTKNYIAKKYGLQTGEAVWQAKQKCPDLVLVPAHYELYLKFSRKLRALYGEYSEKVQPYGLDECWVGLTQRGRTIEDGTRIANEIRQRVKDELGITVSVGVANNMAFAKLGSDMKKPDATSVIPAIGFEDKVWSLPVSDLLFVGSRMDKRFAKVNIRTIGDLATADTPWLASFMGATEMMLQKYALGLDDEEVTNANDTIQEKSVGNSTTPPRDLNNYNDVKAIVYLLSECVAGRVRKGGWRSRTISLSIRQTDLTCYSAQTTLRSPTNLTSEIADAAFRIYAEKGYQQLLPLRSLGVHCDNLVPEDVPQQLDLFGNEEFRAKALLVERAIDGLHARFGPGVVHRGIVYWDKRFTGVGAIENHVGPAARVIPKEKMTV